MRRAPTVFVGVHPFEVFGREVKRVAVLVVALSAFAIGEDGSRSVEGGADEDMALYTAEMAHYGV